MSNSIDKLQLYFCLVSRFYLSNLIMIIGGKKKTRERAKRPAHIIRHAALAIEDLAQPPKEVNTKNKFALYCAILKQDTLTRNR
jgi:hypothetical protein